MAPYLGQSVILYGGLENSLVEHPAVVTFVHQTALSTISEQLGMVNVRVFLDSMVQDRVMRFVPMLGSRRCAVDLNARGGGYCCYPAKDSERLQDEQAPAPKLSPSGTVELTIDEPGFISDDLKKYLETAGFHTVKIENA
jgi:hypothetical protein